MKTVIPIAIVASLLLVGCATTSPTESAVVQLVVTESAATATALVVHNNPSFAPDFRLGSEVLTELSTGTNDINMSDVGATLATSGETNAAVNSIIITAVSSASAFLASQTNGVIQQQEVKSVLGWAADGINEGLPLAPMAAHEPVK